MFTTKIHPLTDQAVKLTEENLMVVVTPARQMAGLQGGAE